MDRACERVRAHVGEDTGVLLFRTLRFLRLLLVGKWSPLRLCGYSLTRSRLSNGRLICLSAVCVMRKAQPRRSCLRNADRHSPIVRVRVCTCSSSISRTRPSSFPCHSLPVLATMGRQRTFTFFMPYNDSSYARFWVRHGPPQV